MRIFGKMSLAAMGVAALAAGATVAVPKTVHADGDVDAAVFLGNTTSLTPAVEWVGGAGGYTFVSTTCVGVSSDDGASQPRACNVTSSGAYTNVVCGTGLAQGSASISENGVPSESITAYTIVFVGTVGVIVSTNGPTAGVVQISGTPSVPDPFDGTTTDPADATPAGLLSDGILGDCVSQFNVAVAAVIGPAGA